MPVPITSYACEFRCGKVNTKRFRIIEHEKSCIFNPDSKSCPTCKHDSIDLEKDYLGHFFGEAEFGPSYKVYYCQLNVRKDKKCIKNCEKYESK